MAYDIKHKFKNSPLPCWKGYERVPGTSQGAKGSCRKSSPTKKYVSDAQRKAVWASKADGGKGNPNKMLSPVKRAAGKAGKYKRSSKSNVKGTSSGGSLKTWVKQDWRQVGNPSKKCGEK